MVVLIFFSGLGIFPTARLNGMMHGNEIFTCQLSRMTFSCYNFKNISRNNNLCIKTISMRVEPGYVVRFILKIQLSIRQYRLTDTHRWLGWRGSAGYNIHERLRGQ